MENSTGDNVHSHGSSGLRLVWSSSGATTGGPAPSLFSGIGFVISRVIKCVFPVPHFERILRKEVRLRRQSAVPRGAWIQTITPDLPRTSRASFSHVLCAAVLGAGDASH